jgi:hypothetical protein
MYTICLQTQLLLSNDVWKKVCEFCGKRCKENLLNNTLLQVTVKGKDGVALKVMISVLNVFILDLPSLHHLTHHWSP